MAVSLVFTRCNYADVVIIRLIQLSSGPSRRVASGINGLRVAKQPIDPAEKSPRSLEKSENFVFHAAPLSGVHSRRLCSQLLSYGTRHPFCS